MSEQRASVAPNRDDGEATAVIATGAMGVAFIVVWFAIPLRRAIRER